MYLSPTQPHCSTSGPFLCLRVLAPAKPTPHLTMSSRALSSDFSWYLMPCLVQRDFTSGAILCKLCRGMVGKRLRGQVGRVSTGRAPCSPPLPTAQAGRSEALSATRIRLRSSHQLSTGATSDAQRGGL